MVIHVTLLIVDMHKAALHLLEALDLVLQHDAHVM